MFANLKEMTKYILPMESLRSVSAPSRQISQNQVEEAVTEVVDRTLQQGIDNGSRSVSFPASIQESVVQRPSTSSPVRANQTARDQLRMKAFEAFLHFSASQRASYLTHFETNYILSLIAMPERQKFCLQYLQSHEITKLIGPANLGRLKTVSETLFDGLTNEEIEKKAQKLNQQFDEFIRLGLQLKPDERTPAERVQEFRKITGNKRRQFPIVPGDASLGRLLLGGDGDQLGRRFYDAVAGGRVELVQFLCAHGFSCAPVWLGLLESNKNGVTALMHAAESGNLEMVQALCKVMHEWHVGRMDSSVSHIAPPNIVKDENFPNLLSCIVKGGNPLIMREFLKLYFIQLEECYRQAVRPSSCKTSIVINGERIPISMVEMKKKEFLKNIKHHFNVTEVDGSLSALRCAAQKGNTEMVRALLDAYEYIKKIYDLDVEINIPNQILMDAAQSGNEAETWMYAVKKGDLNTVKALLNARSSVEDRDSSGKNVLMYAVKQGDLNTVKALLDAGASVESQDNSGKHVLMYAVEGGNPEIVHSMLVAGRINPYFCDKEGMTALMYARNEKIVDILLEAGCQINAQDADGNTALIIAAKRGSKKVVNALLMQDADITIKNKMGKTVLDYVSDNFSYRECRGIVENYIKANGDIKAIDSNGCTVYMRAEESGHDNIVHALRKAGAGSE